MNVSIAINFYFISFLLLCCVLVLIDGWCHCRRRERTPKPAKPVGCSDSSDRSRTSWPPHTWRTIMFLSHSSSYLSSSTRDYLYRGRYSIETPTGLSSLPGLVVSWRHTHLRLQFLFIFNFYLLVMRINNSSLRSSFLTFLLHLLPWFTCCSIVSISVIETKEGREAHMSVKWKSSFWIQNISLKPGNVHSCFEYFL